MKVTPAPGRAVRDPRTFQLLPKEGREVPDNDPFWLRRLRDGDVVRAPQQTPAPAATPTVTQEGA